MQVIANGAIHVIKQILQSVLHKSSNTQVFISAIVSCIFRMKYANFMHRDSAFCPHISSPNTFNSGVMFWLRLPKKIPCGLRHCNIVKNCFLRMVVFLLFPWRSEQYFQPHWIRISTKPHNMTSLKNGCNEIWYLQSTQWTMSRKLILAHTGSSQDQYCVKIKVTYIKYCKLLYAFLWVIPWCPNFICWHFRTPCLFGLHRRISMKDD